MKRKIKKILSILFLVGVILLISFVVFVMFMIPKITSVKANYVLGAHRGNSVEFVENTIEAFESALQKDRYKFIEFDVQYTKDKVMVVHHDKTLKRLQGKSEAISELTYEELLAISDYHIPTYDEVMDLVAGKKPLDIEIKSRGDLADDQKMADFIISDLKKRGVLKSTIISSISKDILFYINKTYDNGFKGWLENKDLCQKEKNSVCNWKKNIYIDTGLISYINKDTFFQIFDWKEPILFKDTEAGVNYFMLYGSNLRAYNSLSRKTPENINLCFWFFTDEIYLVVPEIKKETSHFLDNLFGFVLDEQLNETVENVDENLRENCLWWCDAREELPIKNKK
ncbi:MAG: glycerophosphodiester phosphodiesterase family protein [Patescibacteria group bacterium]